MNLATSPRCCAKVAWRISIVRPLLGLVRASRSSRRAATVDAREREKAPNSDNQEYLSRFAEPALLRTRELSFRHAQPPSRMIAAKGYPY